MCCHLNDMNYKTANGSILMRDLNGSIVKGCGTPDIHTYYKEI